MSASSVLVLNLKFALNSLAAIGEVRSNKTYLDLSAQLQLFLRPDADLGIKPEAYIRSIGL